MTDQQHPITPSRGLVEEWVVKLERHNDAEVFTEAARWGANKELEECINWIRERPCTWTVKQLRAARRPKVKSLGEIALVSLETIEEDLMVGDEAHPNDFVTIRRALERLQELEGESDD